MIYMDNAAAEKPLPIAIDMFTRTVERSWANPNSAHDFGRKAEVLLNSAKEMIAAAMNCLPDEVHFCSTACEAASWVMKTLVDNCANIVIGPKEHECILSCPIPNECRGIIQNGIVSMLYNNETGERTFTDYGIDKSKGSRLFFTDATAAAGHVPVNFKELGVDYLCADALKFGGIPGAAFLIAKKGTPLSPIIYGGGLRGGTPSLAIIRAMAYALRYRCRETILQEQAERVCWMRDYLIEELMQIEGAHLNGAWEKGEFFTRLPGNVNISFEGIQGSSLVAMLSERGIMASSGSACQSGNNEPSHVLLAMGVPYRTALGTLRLTLNGRNTMDECKCVVKEIKDAVGHLRKF